MKKLTSFLVPLIFATTAIYAYEFKVGDLYYNITSSTAPYTVEVTYQQQYSSDDYKGLTSVTIPATVTYNGITYTVTSIGDYAFYGCTGLTEVTILNTVTSIGDRAFEYCTSLTSVTIPTSITSIGWHAFYGCTGLTSITIPNSITSIGWYAFYGCTGLTSITIPNSVTSIGDYTFSGCTGLTSITIPNSVTSIGDYTFSGCTGLTSVTIPNSVTSIGNGAFNNVLNIVYNGTAEGSPWGAKSVNGYVDGYLVYKDVTKTTLLACSRSATGTVTIPESVTSIGESAFSGCTGLTSITIPNNVTSIGSYAFSGCRGLTSVTIGNSVTSIEYNTFAYCTRLTSMHILAAIPPTTIGDNSFEGTPTDIPVYIPCGTKDAYQAAEGWSRFTNFIETPHILTITAQDEAMGTVRITKEATCADNTAVIEATANEGYQFTQWSDGNTDNPRTIVLDKDITLTAQFITATAINNTATDTDTTPQKVLRNGQVLILRNAKTYTVTGVEVE